MNRFNGGRLLAVWCALMLSLPVGIIWLALDISEGHRLAAGIKLFVLLAATSAGGLVVALVISRGWSSRLQNFNQFAAAFPGAETELAVNGPPELESLARTMQGMAERVRSIVERVNLEASRRDTVLA